MRTNQPIHNPTSSQDEYLRFQQQQIEYLRQHAHKQARLSILLEDQNFDDIHHQLDNSSGKLSPVSASLPLPVQPSFSPRYSVSSTKLENNNKEVLKDSVSTTHSAYKELSERARSCREPISDPRGLKKQDFIIGALLGKGKFGSVHVARHKKTGFVCALKVINKAKILQENIQTQLIRQIKIQSYCDHPGLTKLYGYFSSLDQIFLITELSSEGQLYQLIQKSKLSNKPLSEANIAQILKQICEGVRYLHTLKIIHRDLKPENIVMERGVAKICDFGWAVSHNVNLRSTFCGTPLYVSPEILRGECYDEKVDLWAVGILAWELLYGDIPFEINSEQELSKIVTQDIRFPEYPHISECFKDFIQRILRKNPKQRIKISGLIEHPFLRGA